MDDTPKISGVYGTDNSPFLRRKYVSGMAI